MSRDTKKDTKKEIKKEEPATVAQLLKEQKVQIEAALPRHLSSERMTRIALTELRKNPDLQFCCPVSFLGAIIQAAQLGLEPGDALGHCHLVPFNNYKTGKKLVSLIIGYRGFIDLARRSGQIRSISARAVYENDTFEVSYGLRENITHIPANGERGELTHVYAVAQLKDGGVQFELMSKHEVDKVKKNTNFWINHYNEMARKTVIRRLFKYLPVSIEYADLYGKVLEIETAYEAKESQRNEDLLLDAGVEWKRKEANIIDMSVAKGEIAKEDLKYKLIDDLDDMLVEAGKNGIDEKALMEELGIDENNLEKMEPKSLMTFIHQISLRIKEKKDNE